MQVKAFVKTGNQPGAAAVGENAFVTSVGHRWGGDSRGELGHDRLLKRRQKT